MQSEMSILRRELHLGYDREDGLGDSLSCLTVAINELRMSVAEKEATIAMQEEENKSLRAEKDAEIDKLRARTII